MGHSAVAVKERWSAWRQWPHTESMAARCHFQRAFTTDKECDVFVIRVFGYGKPKT